MIGGAQSNASWKNEKVYTKDFRFALFLTEIVEVPHNLELTIHLQQICRLGRWASAARPRSSVAHCD